MKIVSIHCCILGNDTVQIITNSSIASIFRVEVRETVGLQREKTERKIFLPWRKRRQYVDTLLTPWSVGILDKLPGSSAGQDITSILWNPELIYDVHSSLPLFPVLSRINLLKPSGNFTYGQV
jgi:hypothetical protein